MAKLCYYAVFFCIEISTTKREITLHAMPLNLSSSLTAFTV